MPYANEASTGDLAKLQQAIAQVTEKFGSIEDILEAFGLANMPLAQRYGILFGFLVFITTVGSVIILLFLGGSFQRISQQAQTGESTILTPTEARSRRALLYEQLLEGRDRMLRRYRKEDKTDISTCTPLMKMLQNEAPTGRPLNDEPTKENQENTFPGINKDVKGYTIPDFYEENYYSAYRKCQDKPGGSALSGRPEARFEAYARAYAGCGPYTNLNYRRSYARLYEAVCCMNHANEMKYEKHFRERPHDIVGKYIRLEALEKERHVKDVFLVTSGEQALSEKSYDPQEIWGFLEEGPFQNESSIRESFVFQRMQNEAGFAVVNSITEKVIGVVILRHDDPQNLSIQLEPPIVHPCREGTREQLEACFLLIDRLFALGYRRIQISIDSQDVTNGKLCKRLAFMSEGRLYKHMIVKEASRDSNIYSMLNSDWKKGGRGVLFKKLYGLAALRVDTANEKAEEELDERERVLDQQKLEETERKTKKVV